MKNNITFLLFFFFKFLQLLLKLTGFPYVCWPLKVLPGDVALLSLCFPFSFLFLGFCLFSFFGIEMFLSFFVVTSVYCEWFLGLVTLPGTPSHRTRAFPVADCFWIGLQKASSH